ncbi:MAG: hypothetical protein WD771_09600 [Gemmatimonadaceae bacterium]
MTSIVAACGLFTAPVEYEQPELVSLEIDQLAIAIRDGGVLVVIAELSDTVLELSGNERVALEVSTSGGDSERLDLYHLTCPVGSPFRGFHCHDFSIALLAGYDSVALRHRVRAIGGREVRLTNRWLVVVNHPLRIALFARDAAAWPGVGSSSLSYSTCPGCSLKAFLRGPIALENGAARLRDGILQFVSGDTIRARYTNPAGSAIEVVRVAP